MDAGGIPGTIEVPIGPAGPPQRRLALVPHRLSGAIAILTHDDSGREDDPFELVGWASEAQLRGLANACAETADWFHEHTR